MAKGPRTIKGSGGRRTLGLQWTRDAGIANQTAFAYVARTLAPLASARGRSSGVERNLAKVEVVGSNPIARSNYAAGFHGFLAPVGLVAAT
jgi:hypothetical protein